MAQTLRERLRQADQRAANELPASMRAATPAETTQSPAVSARLALPPSQRTRLRRERPSPDATPRARSIMPEREPKGQVRKQRPIALDPAIGERTRRAMGERIRLARERNGWSQADLAAAVGVPRTTVLTWERGRRFPPLAKIVLLAPALDLTLAELCDPTLPIEPPAPEPVPVVRNSDPIHTYALPRIEPTVRRYLPSPWHRREDEWIPCPCCGVVHDVYAAHTCEREI